MPLKLNQIEVINRFISVHGNIKYDYSKFIYTGAHHKGIIICKEHGEFLSTYDKHYIKKVGCKLCKIRKNNIIKKEKQIKKEKRQNKFSVLNVIKKFNIVHDNKYDYSLVKYNGCQNNIDIICKEHGIFKQSPNAHQNGNGCPACADRTYTQEKFINKSNDIHKNKYNYSKTIFKGTKHNIIITCPIHGDFSQEARNHLSGHGCRKCNNCYPKEKEEVVKKFNIVHNNKYDYSEINYINTNTKIKIICPTHGAFWQKPEAHSRGRGCKECAIFGFKKNLPGILYYIRIEKEGVIAYKIGITNKNVKIRFYGENEFITIIKEWYYVDGEECYDQEQKILKEYSYAKWKKEPILRAGNSEMFDRDILLLDN